MTTRRSWLGPALLCLGLLGLHGIATVPKSEMVRRSKKARSHKGAKGKGEGKEHRAFLGERKDPGFIARHQPPLEHAYGLAREHVEARRGPPKAKEAPMAVETECRRWRCRIEICGDPSRARAVHRVLRKIEHEGEALFDAFESVKSPDHKATPEGPLCLETIVRFSRPSPEIKGIRISKATLAEERKRDARKKKRRQRQKERRAKSAEPTKSAGPAEPTESAGPAEPTESAGPAEPTKSAEPTEPAED